MTLHDSSITNRMQLEVKDLAVHYSKEPALKIDTLSIEGTILAVIGHNGSGKSTFIKSLLELIKPKTGTISVSYSDYTSPTTLIPERHMAFSPEHGAIFEDISVESYIRLWCDIKQKDSNYYKKAGAKFIENLELKELFPKMGRELSKGQRRRVQTAAGFMCSPKLFLFDEPFDGLDISQSTKLSNIMLEASKDICLLVSSHRMEVVERIADIIIVLKNGEAFSYGSLEKVCHDLCESCICISTPTSQDIPLEQLIQTLKDEFSNTIVNHVGNQVILSGKDVTKEKVDSFLEKTFGKTFSIENIRPPLMDAMQYHLEYGHQKNSTT
jgi:ABC-2 type transport system ATP-binding protein